MTKYQIAKGHILDLSYKASANYVTEDTSTDYAEVRNRYLLSIGYTMVF